MRRREFITLLAARRRVAARRARAAGERVRRVGIILPATADDAVYQARVGAFLQGWRNWAGPSAATCGSTPAGPRPMPSKFADRRRNWLRSRPTSSWPVALRPWGRCCRRPAPCRSCSRRFDPVGAGLRRQPGAAGRQRHRFHEFRIQPQRQMAGAARRDRAERDASGGASGYDPRLPTSEFAAIQAVAPSLRVEVNPVDMRDAGGIERAVAAFAHAPNGGVILAGVPGGRVIAI